MKINRNQRKVNEQFFVDTAKRCFIRLMKNHRLFPSLYRLDDDVKRKRVWCKFPTPKFNPLNHIQYPTKFEERPQLHVMTHIPQNEYDRIIAVVNNAIHNLVEENPYTKNRRFDCGRIGEELFNQIGYKLYGTNFLEDMRTLDNEMRKSGVQMPPSNREEFEEQIRQMKIDYEQYCQEKENIDEEPIGFHEFVQRTMRGEYIP